MRQGIPEKLGSKQQIFRDFVASGTFEDGELFILGSDSQNAAGQFGFRVAFSKILLETTQSFRT